MSAKTIRHTTEAWIQVVPEIGSGYDSRTGRWSQRAFRGIKAARMTQQRPDKPLPGSVLAKVHFDLPLQAFEPIIEATLRYDEGALDVHVEPGDASPEPDA